MKKLLLIILIIMICAPLLWYGALTIERMSALRAIAQLAHLPADFLSAGTPSSLRRTGDEHFEADFKFSPKYTGRYQILVTPVAKQYGTVVHASSTLTCEAPDKQFKIRADDGRIEFDRALKLGFVGRLLTFDTASHAKVGVGYLCNLSIESDHDLSLKLVHVRKLTDN